MTIGPLTHAACTECHYGYFGEHADWCSHSTATACVVCGRKYHNGRGDGRCLLDDYAHTKGFTTDIQSEAA